MSGTDEGRSGTPYDRAVLVDVLVYHTRAGIRGCKCGWAEPGRSWPEHVATIYEESVAARGMTGRSETFTRTHAAMVCTLLREGRTNPDRWTSPERRAVTLLHGYRDQATDDAGGTAS